jgi:hypothetical protein
MTARVTKLRIIKLIVLLVHSFKYNQQHATLYNILYYCQSSICFRRFLRPSPGAQNSLHTFWYMSSLLLYLKEYINDARSHERQVLLVQYTCSVCGWVCAGFLGSLVNRTNRWNLKAFLSYE